MGGGLNIDKLLEWISKIGVPSAICAGLLYEIHLFFAQILSNQIHLLKNQEIIIEFLRRLIAK